MSNQVKTVGEAREIWNRNGLAWGSGAPDYLFENAEALLKLEGKIATARASAFTEAVQACEFSRFTADNGHQVMADYPTQQACIAAIDALASQAEEK